jgi:uncharacterized protein
VDASQDNVAKLQHAYRLWNDTRGGSSQHWLEMMADDVEMRSVAGDGEEMDFTRGRRGKAGAEQYFARLADDWEMIHFTPEEFIAQGDRVVVVSRVAFRNRRTGKAVESPKADLFRFRDGKIVEFLEFFDTALAIAASRPD